MRIVIPSSIKILHADFPVRVVDKVDEDGNDGASSWGEQWIKIAQDLSHQHQAATLMHEIDHLVYSAGDLNDGEVEEKIVTVMSNIRAQVYRDNPDLLQYYLAVFNR